jgi:hypothetical protein
VELEHLDTDSKPRVDNSFLEKDTFYVFFHSELDDGIPFCNGGTVIEIGKPVSSDNNKVHRFPFSKLNLFEML